MLAKLETQKDIGEIPPAQRHAGRPNLELLFANLQDKQDRNNKIQTAHFDYGYTLKQIADALVINYTTVSRVSKKGKIS